MTRTLIDVSNSIAYRGVTQTTLGLSNGSMSVLMSVLVLAGSELARTEWEKRFVAWLARHDQSVFGLGMVSFDLADIPFTAEWETERGFALRMTDLALEGFRFEDLDYDPPFVKAQLATLRTLIKAIGPEVVATSATKVFEDADQPIERCELHDVYAHGYGCILCGEDIPPSKNRPSK